MLAIELALSLLTIGAGNVFTATDGGRLVGGIVLKFILNLVSYYFVIIQAHIMGRILRERRDVLTWAA